MKASLAALRAALLRNKTTLGVAGAGVVALVAWRAKSSAKADPAAPATAAGVSSSPVSQSAGGYTASASGYDSSASDVYNAIQPQIEALSNLWSKTSTPIPVPEKAPAVTVKAPTALGFVSYLPNSGSQGAMYELFNNGSKRWISYAEQQLKGIKAPTVLHDAQIAAYSKTYTPPTS